MPIFVVRGGNNILFDLYHCNIIIAADDDEGRRTAPVAPSRSREKKAIKRGIFDHKNKESGVQPPL